MKRTEPSTLQEALTFLSQEITPVQAETIILNDDAAGSVIAEDCIASTSLPRFDNAAMDGFAVRSSDIDILGTANLRIAHTIAAGGTSIQELARGTTAHIMTGSPVPLGASRIVWIFMGPLHSDARGCGGNG